MEKNKILTTLGVGCPKCGSKNIEQVPMCKYPFMHCKTCDEVYWSEKEQGKIND